MTVTPPKYTKVLTIKKPSVHREPPYHDTLLIEIPVPTLKAGEILVQIGAAAFNRRDVWIRAGLYPRIVMGSVFGADGAGTVIASGTHNDPLLHERVFLTPMRGWKKDPDAPESEFGILGSGSLPPIGTFAEYVVVERDQVILTPEHLDDVHASAWPLAGLTGWRAAIICARVEAGHNVLITGIGGGVALIAMQICLAKGAFVYVTSGSQKKIQKAVSLGARGGANYKDKDWPTQIMALLAEDGRSKGILDSVIDSGGGDIMGQTSKFLKQGGRIVCYGMTASPRITMTMREVLKNQQLIGSTMGSHQDLIDATRFLRVHRIVPVVSHVLDGLESAEDGFELIRHGEHFGKVVIRIPKEDTSEKAKL